MWGWIHRAGVRRGRGGPAGARTRRSLPPGRLPERGADAARRGGHRLRLAERHRPQIPARPARHRVPLRLRVSARANCCMLPRLLRSSFHAGHNQRQQCMPSALSVGVHVKSGAQCMPAKGCD